MFYFWSNWYFLLFKLIIVIIIIFKVRAKPHQIGVWDPLVCGTRDPPLPSDLMGKVYGGIYTLPPSGFELVTS